MPIEKNILNEDDQNAYFEKAELNHLKAALERSFKDRFLMTTRLYKIQQTLLKAKITHQPYTLEK